MATQSVSTLNHTAGLNLTSLAVAADTGANAEKWIGTGAEMLYIITAATGFTLTLAYGVGGTIDGQALPAKTFILATTTAYLMGPFPTNLYNDVNSFMNITYSVSPTGTKLLVFIRGT